MQADKKIKIEKSTVRAMIGLYCKAYHGTDANLCPDCAGLAKYSETKLDRCPYGSSKPACSKCSVHCYNIPRRKEIRRVMRYAGPKMLCRHPGLSVMYIINKLKS